MSLLEQKYVLALMATGNRIMEVVDEGRIRHHVVAFIADQAAPDEALSTLSIPETFWETRGNDAVAWIKAAKRRRDGKTFLRTIMGNLHLFHEDDLASLTDVEIEVAKKDCEFNFDELLRKFIAGKDKLEKACNAIFELTGSRNLKETTRLSVSGAEVPVEIVYLVNLEELSLGMNKLTTLPDEIGSLKNLKKLCLWSNQLTSLPPGIKHLVNLEDLHLSWNKLKQIYPMRLDP